MSLFKSVIICGNQHSVKTSGIAGNLLSVSEDHDCISYLSVASFNDISVKITTTSNDTQFCFKDVQTFLELFCENTPDVFELDYSCDELLVQLNHRGKSKAKA